MTDSPNISVNILYQWDEDVCQTASSRPANSKAALICWTVLPLPIDEGVPQPIIRTVAETAAALGTVAFRLFFNDDLADGLTVHPASRAWLGKNLWEWVTRSWPATIATATTADAAAEMFLQDWHLQGQTALVLRADSLSQDSMNQLRRVRDWRSRSFPADARLLIAPCVDGEGAMFAASQAHELEEALQMVVRKLKEAGIPVTVEDSAR